MGNWPPYTTTARGGRCNLLWESQAVAKWNVHFDILYQLNSSLVSVWSIQSMLGPQLHALNSWEIGLPRFLNWFGYHAADRTYQCVQDSLRFSSLKLILLIPKLVIVFNKMSSVRMATSTLTNRQIDIGIWWTMHGQNSEKSRISNLMYLSFTPIWGTSCVWIVRFS